MIHDLEPLCFSRSCRHLGSVLISSPAPSLCHVSFAPPPVNPHGKWVFKQLDKVSEMKMFHDLSTKTEQKQRLLLFFNVPLTFAISNNNTVVRVITSEIYDEKKHSSPITIQKNIIVHGFWVNLSSCCHLSDFVDYFSQWLNSNTVHNISFIFTLQVSFTHWKKSCCSSILLDLTKVETNVKCVM